MEPVHTNTCTTHYKSTVLIVAVILDATPLSRCSFTPFTPSDILLKYTTNTTVDQILSLVIYMYVTKLNNVNKKLSYRIGPA